MSRMPMNYEVDGKIFIYDTKWSLKAYSNGISSDAKVVLVGGLGCCFPIEPFSISLNKYCVINGYEFIIPQLRSHPTFGLFTLDDDMEDLDVLLKKIGGDVILIGCSTGCQDILYYLKKKGRGNIKLVVLQGAVSDVEYEEHTSNNLEEFLLKARNAESDVAFLYKGNYITPKRFLDLFSRNGKEDMFSSYLSDESFKRLNQTGVKILFVISERDEYRVTDVESKFKLVENSKVIIIPNGRHVLSDPVDIEQFLEYFDNEIKDAIH